jgi:GGDEF domain-containing protein
MDKRRHLAGETGLYTYEVFEVLLDYETTRIRRYPSPITLLHLSLAADELEGDFRTQAHAAMVSLLDRSLRVSDVPAHYHSEFLILLPATDEPGGRAVAERTLASYRTTQSIATGRLSKRRNAYMGLTTQDGSALVTSQQLLAEAAMAMNEARLRQSYTYIGYSDLAKPGNL